jgi:hypothetical protein
MLATNPTRILVSKLLFKPVKTHILIIGFFYICVRTKQTHLIIDRYDETIYCIAGCCGYYASF